MNQLTKKKKKKTLIEERITVINITCIKITKAQATFMEMFVNSI